MGLFKKKKKRNCTDAEFALKYSRQNFFGRKSPYLLVITVSDLVWHVRMRVLDNRVSSDSNSSRQHLICEWMTAIWPGLNLTEINSWRASSETTQPKLHTNASFSIWYVPAEFLNSVRKTILTFERNFQVDNWVIWSLFSYYLAV